MKINKKQVRSFAINDVDKQEDKPFISMSLSSEAPYLRSFGNEILMHGLDNINMSRTMPNGLPMLVNHDDTQLPIGRLKNVRIDLETKRLRADAYFSNRPEAQAVRQDILDGVLGDVSIGYKILDHKLERSNDKDTPNNVFVTKWMPYEGSIVAVAADHTVGVGRSDIEEIELELEQEEAQEAQAGTEDAESQSSEGDPILAPLPSEDAVMNAESPSEEAQEASAEPVVSPTDTDIAQEETEETEQEEEVEEAEEVDNTDEDTLNAESGISVSGLKSNNKDNDKDDLLIKKSAELKAIKNSALKLGLKSEDIDLLLYKAESTEEAKSQLINASPNIITNKKSITKENNKMDEKTLYRNLQAAIKGEYSKVDEGLFTSGYLRSNSQGFNADLFLTRADSYTSTTNGGTNTIYEQNIGFLELLRARTAVLNAGGKTKVGIGNLSYIRQKQAVTAVLRGENTGSVTASNADFEKVPYTPKALVAKVLLTDELQKESIVDLQNVLRDDMVKQFAIAIDNYAINGATSPVITGLLNNTGIYNGDLGTAGLPTWAEVNKLKALVDQKAVDLSKCAFITTSGLQGVLEATQMFPNYGVPVSSGNKINGYPVYTSNNVPVNVANHTLIFGDFSNLEICLQGPTEFMVDTQTRFDEGITVLTARQYFDVGVLQPSAFAKTANFLIA